MSPPVLATSICPGSARHRAWAERRRKPARFIGRQIDADAGGDINGVFYGIHHHSRVSSRRRRWQLCCGHPWRVRHRLFDRLSSLRLRTRCESDRQARRNAVPPRNPSIFQFRDLAVAWERMKVLTRFGYRLASSGSGPDLPYSSIRTFTALAAASLERLSPLIAVGVPGTQGLSQRQPACDRLSF
jgi:hypothetical protein